jgi:tetratricopeptide (TPR) repeat protein
MVLLLSCNKDFLKENSRTDLDEPNSVKDLWALLDNDNVMNSAPVMGELSSDNYYISYEYWQSLSLKHEQNCYIWAKDIFQGQQNSDDWSRCYAQVYYANSVIEKLREIPGSSSGNIEMKAILGSALFYRANAFFNLAQVFAPAYDSSTAASDLGLPIRTRSNIHEKVERHTVKQTYDSILSYLDRAENLVYPNIQFAYKNRVSKPAVLALKARVYLSMGAYAQAGEYANKVLALYDSLLNYNELNSTLTLPFTRENKEVIFQSQFHFNTRIMASFVYPDVLIDSVLLGMYDSTDLRLTYFYISQFPEKYNMKGNYSGTVFPFAGLATDELYLIRAEANAISGKTADAINDINQLLENRYVAGTFTPLTPGTPADVLQLVRNERRKELAFRGLRWSDLRRYNREGANITLQRVLNGTTYTLPPNSKLYVLPLPPEVITLGGLVNNDR